MTRHAIWRAVVLIALGVAIAPIHPRELTWTFEDILPQVGLGYAALFWLVLRPPRLAWHTLAVILVGYRLAFALYPVPGPEFDYAAVKGPVRPLLTVWPEARRSPPPGYFGVSAP